MKIIRKILLFLGVATLSFSLGISAFASEASTVSESAESVGESDSGDTNTTYEKGDISENPFEEIFSTVLDHSSEMFSALAFIGTIIVAYFYKKGILPTLSKALTGVSTALDSVGEKTDGALGPIITKTDEIADTTAFVKSSLDGVVCSLEELEKSLDSLKESENERHAYSTIMLSQVDMLYDIFMSSALPQYKKDEVGERICKMREELKFSDKRGDEIRDESTK